MAGIPSLELARTFPGLKQDDQFAEVAKGLAAKLALVAKEISALSGSIPVESDDALVDLVGRVFSDVIRTVAQRVELRPDDAEVSADVLGACLEVCAGLVQKQWTSTEGILAQIRVILGEGPPLEWFYQNRGLVETKQTWGKSFTVWPASDALRRTLLARGLALVNRQVKLATGEEGTITGFDVDTMKHEIKIGSSAEPVRVELNGSEILGSNNPADLGYTEIGSKSHFIRLLVPPTSSEAIGHWVTAKIISPMSSSSSPSTGSLAEGESKASIVTIVTDEGERIDFDASVFWANAASSASSSPLRYLRHANETSGDPILTQALSAVETTYKGEPEWTWTVRPSSRTEKARSYWHFYVVERFLKSGGMEGLIRLVWKDVADLSSILSVVERLAGWLCPEKRVWVAEKLASAIMFKQFTEQELRTMGGIPPDMDASLEHAYLFVLNQLKNLKNAQYLHRYRLQLLFQLVCSSSLPQRLMGISQLANMICFASHAGSELSSGPNSPEAATASQFLLQERVIERVFTDKPHVEIVRRSLPLLSFLVSRDELGQSQLDAIWSAMMKEEGSTAQAMYSIVLDLVPAIRNAQLRTWFVSQKLALSSSDAAGITLKDLEDDDRLKFVYDLSMETMLVPDLMSPKGQNNNTTNAAEQQHPGIALLWKFVFDPASTSTPKRMRTALRYLGELIGSVPVAKKRIAAIDACVKHFGEVQLVPQALLLIERVLLSFASPDDESSAGGGSGISSLGAADAKKSIFSTFFGRGVTDSRKSMVMSLEGKHKLMKLVLAGLERYSNQLEYKGATATTGTGTANAIKKRRSTTMLHLKGAGNGANAHAGGFGVFSHSEQIAIRLDFIAFLLRSSALSLKLPEKSLDLLWRTCLIDAKTDDSRRVALEWFARAHTASVGPSRSPLATQFLGTLTAGSATRPAFGDDAELWVLQKGFPSLLSKCAPDEISALDADVFIDYFLNFNRKQKALRFISNGEGPEVLTGATDDDDSRRKRAIRSAERLSPDLVGLESLWALCLRDAELGETDQAEDDGGDEIFARCSSLLVQLHLSVGLKDAKKCQELRESFCQRCLSNISSTSGKRSKAKWVLLLKQFLQRAAMSANEMCRLVVLPPLAGIPGSLTRREEAPCTKTGPVTLRVSLNTRLDHLKRVLIPKALDYHGQDILALRVVHQHPFASSSADSDAAQSLSSSRFVLIPLSANGKTLRELGFEGLVVLQCYESAQVKASSYSSFGYGGGSFGNRSLLDEIDEDDEEDDDDDDDENDDEDVDLVEDNAADGVELGEKAVDDGLEGEIARLCSSKYDADPMSWPGPFTLSPSSLAMALPVSRSVLEGSSLSAPLLEVLLKASKTEDEKLLADLWDCALSLPVDSKVKDALLTSTAETFAFPTPADEPFGILQTLRAIEFLCASSDGDAFTTKFKATGGPEKVLELLQNPAFAKLPASLERACGKVLFLSCYRWVAHVTSKENVLPKVVSASLEWASATKSRAVLKFALGLVEKSLLLLVGNPGALAADMLQEKTQRLILDRLLASPHARERNTVASSLVRCAAVCPSLNVLTISLTSALDDLLYACRGEKEFDLKTAQGRQLRRRKSRTCESTFLLCARLIAAKCQFETEKERRPEDWFARAKDALLSFPTAIPGDDDSDQQIVPHAQENDLLFIGLVRLVRAFVLRGAAADANNEDLVRFLISRCLLPAVAKTALPSAATVVAQEACMGLLYSLVVDGKSSSSMAREQFFQLVKEETLLPSPAAISASSASSTLTLGRRRFYNHSGATRSMTTLANHHAHQQGGKKTSSASCWEVDITRLLMSSPLSSHHHPLQFAGIGNLGATCYQNSLLQQLFHVMGFSSGLLSSSSSAASAGDKKDSDSLLYHLQMIFASMYTSSERAIETKPFCSVIRDYDGSPINVVEQKDVQEFCDLLFTRLESCSDNQVKSLLAKSFGGTYLQRTESVEPKKPYVSDRFDPFYLVQVDIKGKSTLKEALDGLVAKTRLVGENRCELPGGGEKVDATVQTLFAKLPPHLMIHLKRFEFHYETMTKAKLDDFLSFPLELDMEPYCCPPSARKGAGDEEQDENYYKYELNGILVHSGGADSGHYYSFIRERVAQNPAVGRQWFEFNDELVWPYAVDRIPRDCFGGYDQISRPNGAMVEVPRSQSAYILVYDRVSVVQSWKLKGGGLTAPPQQQDQGDIDEDDDGDDEEEDQMSQQHSQQIKGRPFGSVAIPPSVLTSLATAKQQLAGKTIPTPTASLDNGWTDRVVFHPMFAKFCRDLLSEVAVGLEQQTSLASPSRQIIASFDLAMAYLCQILVRSCASGVVRSSRSHHHHHHRSTTTRMAVLEDWILLLERCCRTSPFLATRLLEMVTTKTDAWLRPLFVECPSRPCRRRFAELLLLCAESLMLQQDFSESEGREDQAAMLPILYQTSSVPRHRAVWLLDMLVHIADSTTSAGGPIPASELFALLLELIRLNKRTVVARFTRRYGGAGAFLDMYVRRSYRYQMALSASNGGGGAGGSYRVSPTNGKRTPVPPLALMISGSNPRLSALGELVLELAEHSGPEELQGLSGTASDRFVEAAIKIRDLSAAVKGARLFWGGVAVERLLRRLTAPNGNGDLTPKHSSQSDSTGLTFDDFAVVGDYFRAFPVEASAFSPAVVDAMVEIINRSIGDPDAFPTDDLINASRCLGTVMASSKSATEYFKTQHKKTVVAWPKDLANAIKQEAKRIDQGGPLLNGNGSFSSAQLVTQSFFGGGSDNLVV